MLRELLEKQSENLKTVTKWFWIFAAIALGQIIIIPIFILVLFYADLIVALVLFSMYYVVFIIFGVIYSLKFTKLKNTYVPIVEELDKMILSTYDEEKINKIKNFKGQIFYFYSKYYFVPSDKGRFEMVKKEILNNLI